MLKAITLLALSALTIGFSGWPACREQQNKNDRPVVENQKADLPELKTLAEGSHSAIEEPFVAVIRDAETYQNLRELDQNLPSRDEEFFRMNVVVAAFLGTRNTGGYSVEISYGEKGQIRVAEKTPPKGSMTTQVITSPFKLVSFATNGTPPVTLSLAESFQQRAERYRVSTGKFTLSGGFAGGTESFQLKGKLNITRLGKLLTIGFALVSSGGQRERSLRDTATGFIKDEKIQIVEMSHGSLLDPPSGDLQASGKFLEKNRLSLDISSKPINVPENYNGTGSIVADLVGASAN